MLLSEARMRRETRSYTIADGDALLYQLPSNVDQSEQRLSGFITTCRLLANKSVSQELDCNRTHYVHGLATTFEHELLPHMGFFVMSRQGDNRAAPPPCANTIAKPQAQHKQTITRDSSICERRPPEILLGIAKNFLAIMQACCGAAHNSSKLRAMRPTHYNGVKGPSYEP